VSFVIEYNYPDAVLDFLRDVPEVTAFIIEDGSWSGGFKVECYIAADADRQEFAKALIGQVLAKTSSGELQDDSWDGEGGISRDMTKWQDAWLVEVRQAPAS